MNAQEDLTFLRSVRGRIPRHHNWCRGTLGDYTRDRSRVCLLGAGIWSVSGRYDHVKLPMTRELKLQEMVNVRLMSLLGIEDIEDFNDNNSHGKVLQRLDDSIARLEEQVVEPLAITNGVAV